MNFCPLHSLIHPPSHPSHHRPFATILCYAFLVDFRHVPVRILLCTLYFRVQVLFFYFLFIVIVIIIVVVVPQFAVSFLFFIFILFIYSVEFFPAQNYFRFFSPFLGAMMHVKLLSLETPGGTVAILRDILLAVLGTY